MSKRCKASPLLELLRGDKPRSGVTTGHMARLPPGVILRTDDLKDVASFESDGRILARDGRILTRAVVEESPDKQLGREHSGFFF